MSIEKFILIPASLWQRVVSQQIHPSTSSVRELQRNHNEGISQVNTPSPIIEPKSSSYQSDFTRIENQVRKNSNTISIKRTILDYILQNERITLSQNDRIILDDSNTGLSVVQFIDNLCKRKSQVKDIYFTILDISKVPPHLIINDYAQQKSIGDWVPFRI